MLKNYSVCLVLVSLAVVSCSRPEGAASVRDIAAMTVPSRKINSIPFEADSLLTLSYKDLQHLFGETNFAVKDVDSFLPHGKYHIVVAFAATDKELELVFEDSTADATVKAVILTEASRWSTTAGISPGMTLKELEALNGKPFLFYGGGWDQGGYVTNWNGGKLEGKVKSIRLDRNHIMPYDLSKGDYDSHEFSSDSKDAQAGNPIVEEVTLAHY
ncbi:MAG TPA: hypothetical protein VGD40_01020 [Chryseosolibacter sp.]